jgi:alkylphosphonate utilization operon protein PhnA
MTSLPPCPKCGSAYSYDDGFQLVCPECAHEWPRDAAPDLSVADAATVIRDSNGNALADGDTITVIQDLKIKGTSLVVKVGTKVKNIRLVDGDHDIDCKIDGIGAMKLKSEFVRKVLAIWFVLVAVLATAPTARAQTPTQTPTLTATLTAQQVIARIQMTLGGTWGQGVDTFKDGDPNTPVTGVAVTMMATMEVLQKAEAIGANLVIAHEPTFYAHDDTLTALEALRDPVVAAKRAFIREHHMVVFRMHDHWHAPTRIPDPVAVGIFRALDWQRFQAKPELPVVVLPATTVGALAKEMAARLDAHAVRIIGDLNQRVTKIGFLPGASGFDMQRHFLQRDDVEVLVIGEAREWETIPYVADLIVQGKHKALIVLGHVPSEEAGMEEFVRWLALVLPEAKVSMIHAGDPFSRPR